MKLRTRLLNWLFTTLFGELDVDARIYTSEDHILIVRLDVVTRFGEFSFPLLNKQLPKRGEGYVIDSVPGGTNPGAIIDTADLANRSGFLGLLQDEDEATRPA